MEICKLFKAPKGFPFFGILCVFEDPNFFYGYLIGENRGNKSIKVRFAKKNEIKYINCDSIYQIRKNQFKLEYLESPYKLNQLRPLTEIFLIRVNNQIIDAKNCEVAHYFDTTFQQRKNRKNPEFHKRLKQLKAKMEIAQINCNKNAYKKAEAERDEILKMMGYKETVNSSYRTRLIDTVTNPIPFSGGGCTPR